MIDEQQYVVRSLELHLFFARIMKEHAIFLEAGFTPANSDFSKTANQYKAQFEMVLHNAVLLGNGVVRPQVLASGEILTDYTLCSEEQTQHFTGIVINQNITKMEATLHSATEPQITPALMEQVKQLNTHASGLLDGLIAFKTRVLDDVLSCHMFTANYPLLIDHIRREAEEYKRHIEALEAGQNTDDMPKDIELFWDQIMMEHALFIRGTLDPTENELIHTSNAFAQAYDHLLQSARTVTEATMQSVLHDTLQETLKFHEFKEAGVKGITECKVRSTILPLLADHVLRESNHFIRLLRQFG